jgi:hypothetical protein
MNDFKYSVRTALLWRSFHFGNFNSVSKKYQLLNYTNLLNINIITFQSTTQLSFNILCEILYGEKYIQYIATEKGA